MKVYFLPVLLLFVLSSCGEDDFEQFNERNTETVTAAKEFPQVDQALWPYFRKFEAEALQRGLQIDLSQGTIKGVISEIEQEQVAGRCNYHSQQPELVTIDQTFWNNSNEFLKEAVVFHELGHCQLVRGHREAQSNAGRCKSLMASGTEGCLLEYRTDTREEYLDELFSAKFAGDWF